MQRLNGREIYVIILLVIVTVILTVAFVMGLVSDYSTLPGEARESIKIKDLVDHINTLLLVVLGMVACVLMLKKKPAGWVLALTMLSLAAFITGIGMITATAGGVTSVTFIAVGIIVIFFIMGIIFLFIPSTLQKYRVSKKVILPTLLLFMALAAFYTFLQ